MKTKTFKVTFWSVRGESLGAVEVQASTKSKAKVLANTLYTCSWSTLTVEAA